MSSKTADIALQKDYFLTLDKLLNLPPLEWLVKDLIPKGGVGVLYGASNSYKSFLALHLSLCCAAKREAFPNKPCKQALAFYIAAEGAGGFKQRTEAWMKHYGVQPEHFHLRPIPVYLSEKTMLQTLIAEIKERNLFDAHCFVVIDTLSTNFSGNENSNEMAVFMQACVNLSKEANATVMIVHHTGKDENRGARGHNSLIANADFVIGMRGGNMAAEIRVEKLKDSPTGLEMNLKAIPITLNTKAEIPGSLIIEEAGAFESEGVDDKTILLFKHLVSLDQESITQKELVQQLIDEYCWKKVTAEKLIQRRLPVSMPVDIAGYTIRRTGRGKAQKHIHIKAKRQADTSPM